MKKLSFLILFFLPTAAVIAQPAFDWAATGICSTDDEARAVAVDDGGNIYIAGTFTSTIWYDTFALEPRGGTDAFLAKYNGFGELQWIKAGGSIADETAAAVETDNSGNIYVTGSYGKRITYPVTMFDTAWFSGNYVISKGNEDMFVAKYDPGGNLVWLKGYGSEYTDVPAGLACTYSGKLLLTGTFGGYGGSPPVYGTIDFDTITVTSEGNGDVFVVCQDLNGSSEWVKSFGSPQVDCSVNIAIDSSDNIYLAGSFSYHISFGAQTLTSISTGSVGGDLFVAKLDAGGNTLWAKPVGGFGGSWGSPGSVFATAMAVTPSGCVYFAGEFNNCSLRLHDGSTLANTGPWQMFLVRYNTAGHVIWSREMGGNGDDEMLSVWADASENAYLSGRASDMVFFGPDTLDTYGGADAFIAKYDSSGNEGWVAGVGGAGYDIGKGITGSPDGQLYVTGSFQSEFLNFGNGILPNTGMSDMFLVKLGLSTSVNEPMPPANDVDVYPNPFTEVINIHSKQGFNKAILYNQFGEAILRHSCDTVTNSTTISLADLPPALYYLRLIDGEGKIAPASPIIKK